MVSPDPWFPVFNQQIDICKIIEEHVRIHLYVSHINERQVVKHRSRSSPANSVGGTPRFLTELVLCLSPCS